MRYSNSRVIRQFLAVAPGNRLKTWGRKLHLERLEVRCLLSASPPASYYQVTPDWFATLGTSSNSSNGDQWIVRLAPEALSTAPTVAAAAELLRQNAFPTQVLRGLGLPGQLLVSSGNDATGLAQLLSGSPLIASFERDSAVNGSVLPNDPLFAPGNDPYQSQYSLFNSDNLDSDIDATKAWDITTGSSDVIVAVIDSGIDYLHPDLAANIWTNAGEIAGNGIDDDGNGYIDDIRGYDFHNHDNDPMDDQGHGTHIAGTIGAVGNNNLGVTGMNWTTSIMPLKLLDENNTGSVAHAVEAINYVTMMRTRPVDPVNVRVINASWGGSGVDDAQLRAAILTAGNAGILFVTAAGNGDVFGRGQNIDQLPFFPASFNLDDEVVVAATDRNDQLATFSNYGPNTVDIAAPGLSIISTNLFVDGPTTTEGYATRSGTSMATPLVTGTAALVWATAPNATVAEVKDAILRGVDSIASLSNKIAGAGRLNAFGALRALPPQAVVAVNGALNVTTPGATSYQFTVELTSNEAIIGATIGAGDFVVHRQGGGGDLPTTLVGTPTSANSGRKWTATYQITPPGGTWDVFDTGIYEIELQAGEVTDTNNVPTIEKVIGTFAVDLSSLGVFRPDVFTDGVDANPGDGFAKTAGNVTTLRAAIQEANLLNLGIVPTGGTVILKPGTYSLSIAGASEDAAASGDLDITGKVTIASDGTGEVIINASGIDRVLDVQATGNLTLSGITITGGNAALDLGGGIRNLGNVTITASTITMNTAGQGGGIFNESNATANITDSTIDHNSAASSGAEFLVSADSAQRINASTVARQNTPRTAANANGQRVVVWNEDIHRIMAQRFDATGAPIGGNIEVVVNNDGYPGVGWEDVCVFSDGGFAVAYTNSSGGAWQGIFAKIFNASGVAVTGEFPITSEPIGGSPHLADQSGDLIVTWYAGNGVDQDIFRRRFNQSGAAIDAASRVNTITSVIQQVPRIALLPGGGFVIVWESNDSRDADGGVFGQRFDAAGNMVGDEFQINSSNPGFQDGLDVAADANGFTVIWRDSGTNPGVYGRRYDLSGNSVGSQFRISSDLVFFRPRITILPGGGFVVAWQELTPASNVEIFLQAYDSAASPLSAATKIASRPNDVGSERSVAVSANPDGTIFVTWEGESLGGQEAIIARTYRLATPNGGGIYNAGTLNATNTTISSNSAISQNENTFIQTFQSEFFVNTETGVNQQSAEIATDGNGHSLITWLRLEASNPVAARFFDTAGSASTQFIVAPEAGADPAVGMDAQGKAIVIFEDADAHVFARQYDATTDVNGSSASAAFAIDSGAMGLQINPKVAANAVGAAVTVWDRDSGSSYSVVARRLSTSGPPIGNDIPVNLTPLSGVGSLTPDVAIDALGRFVIVWEKQPNTGIFARMFDAQGNPITGEILVNQSIGRSLKNPRVAFDQYGFVAVWESDDEVRARSFDGAGNALSIEFQLAEDLTAVQSTPQVTKFIGGQFYSVWSSTGGPGDILYDVHGQLFSSSGAPMGMETVLNTTRIGSQDAPAVQRLSANQLLVVWDLDDGSPDSKIQGTIVTISAQDSGSGIYNTGTLTMTNGTVFNNTAADKGGGITNAAGGVTNLRNSVVANNTPSIFYHDVTGDFTSLGGNLIGDGGVSTGFMQPTDQVGTSTAPVDAKLGPLVDNGGPTKTHLPAADSPAIDAGVAAGAPSTDQRGVARPQDGNNNSTALVDIGAVERYYSSISGRVFQDNYSDWNDNGIRDPNEEPDGIQDFGETGIAGWTVFLDANVNGLLDPNEISTTTDAQGNYTFTQLVPGNYTVAQVITTGWTRTHTATTWVQEFTDAANPALGLAGASSIAATADGKFVYVTGAAEAKIQRFSRNATTGQLTPLGTTSTTELVGGTSVLQHVVKIVVAPAATSSGLYLYALSTDGALTVFTINPATGDLTLSDVVRNGDARGTTVSRLVGSTGLAVSADGLRVYVSNFSASALNGGTLLAFERVGGQLPELRLRRILNNGAGSPVVNGAGGRGVATYGNHVYVVGETVDALDSLAMFTLAAAPAYLNYTTVLRNGQNDSAGHAISGLDGANDIAISSDGRFVYVSAATSGAVTLFARDTTTGVLTFVESLSEGAADGAGNNVAGVQDASSVAISADGTRVYVTGCKYFADLDLSVGAVAVFKRNAATGRLTFLHSLVDGVPDVLNSSIENLENVIDVLAYSGFTYAIAGGDENALTVFRRDTEGQDGISLLVGDDRTGMSFSNYASPGEIRGTVYNDLNNNGLRDQDEYGLGGVIVYLDETNFGTFDFTDLNNNQKFDEGEPSEPYVMTSLLGTYEFPGLTAPRTYTVRLNLPANQSVTSPSTANNRQWQIALNPQQIYVGADFSVHTTIQGQDNNNQISGKVWQDLNKDGIKDANEPYLAGRQVYIDVNDNRVYDAGTDILAAQPTSATGTYFFTGLGATNFAVRVITNSNELTSTPVGNAFSKQTLTTGANPLGLVTADFNNDTLPDLASVDGSTDRVSIRLQLTGGTFATRTEYLVGVQPTSIAVGKFDNNSSPDIAVVQWAYSKVVFLLNNGDGTFARSPYEVPISSGYSTVVAADIDSDGDDDLAVAVDGASDAIHIMRNNGGGSLSFTQLQQISLGTDGPLSLAAGDLTGDNRPDLAVGNFDGDNVRVLKNNSGTSFTLLAAVAVGDGPSSVAIVPDMTGDGNRDVVVASIGANTVTILAGNGSAGGLSLTTPIPVGQGPRSVTVVDVDQDNDLDLVVGRATSNDIVVLRKQGASFSFPESTGQASFANLAASGVKQVLVSDLNKDGLLDVAAVRGDANAGSLLVLNNALAPGSIRLTLTGSNQQVSGQDFGITTIVPPLLGDYDQNGFVQQADYAYWRSHFSDTTGTGLVADGSANGSVDAADYVLWRKAMPSSPPSVIGDYDQNGVVQQADYTFWHTHFSDASGAGLAADGNGNGAVDAADYVLWREQLGPGSAAATASSESSLLQILENQVVSMAAVVSAPQVLAAASHTSAIAKDSAFAQLSTDKWPQHSSSRSLPICNAPLSQMATSRWQKTFESLLATSARPYISLFDSRIELDIVDSNVKREKTEANDTLAEGNCLATLTKFRNLSRSCRNRQ